MLCSGILARTPLAGVLGLALALGGGCIGGSPGGGLTDDDNSDDGADGGGGGDCEALTCEGRCDTIDDGCGGSLDCGDCSGPAPACNVTVAAVGTAGENDPFRVSITSANTTYCESQVDNGPRTQLNFACSGTTTMPGRDLGGPGMHTYSVYVSGPGGGPVQCTSPAYEILGGAAGVCRIDAFAWRPDTSQYAVIANGSLYVLNAAGALVAGPTDLNTLPGLANGPCAAQGAVCHLDALTWRADLNLFFALYDGELYPIDGAGNAAGAAISLDTLPGFDAGPCATQAAGACRVEGITWNNAIARGFVVYNGRFWIVDAAGNLADGSTAAGASISTGGLAAMCAAAGGSCPIDDLTWRDDVARFEVISTGRLWLVNAALAAQAGSGADLETFTAFTTICD